MRIETRTVSALDHYVDRALSGAGAGSSTAAAMLDLVARAEDERIAAEVEAELRAEGWTCAGSCCQPPKPVLTDRQVQFRRRARAALAPGQ